MNKNESAKYELGVVKEYGENEAIIVVNDQEYHVLLNDEDSFILEDLLLNEDIDYVAFDTEQEKIIFDDVLDMNNEALIDDEGVTTDGEAE